MLVRFFAEYADFHAYVILDVEPIEALKAATFSSICKAVLDLLACLNFSDFAFLVQDGISTIAAYTFLGIVVKLSTQVINLHAFIVVQVPSYSALETFAI